MKLYVWRNGKVLKNYTSGMIVVTAHSLEEALSKLKEANFRAYQWLTKGLDYVFYESDLEFVDDEDYVDWVMPTPEEYTMDNLPVLVITGGG